MHTLQCCITLWPRNVSSMHWSPNGWKRCWPQASERLVFPVQCSIYAHTRERNEIRKQFQVAIAPKNADDKSEHRIRALVPISANVLPKVQNTIVYWKVGSFEVLVNLWPQALERSVSKHEIMGCLMYFVQYYRRCFAPFQQCFVTIKLEPARKITTGFDSAMGESCVVGDTFKMSTPNILPPMY